jgi:GT2 family glycosyltransferase
MKTVALILTYNRKEMLNICIDAVLSQKSKTDIIVVDNGSEDGTSALFTGTDARYARDSIHYFNTGLNTGCAGGSTFGIRKAAELGYDLVWLMDDDCVPSDTALSELLRYASEYEGRFGFLSSKVLWKDGSICRMNLQRRTLTRNVKDMSPAVIPVVMASFASLLIPMDVIRDVGLPYRQFFIWTDDWEYTRRISLKYPCMMITSSEVTHYIKDKSKADISTAAPDRLHRFRYLYRNDVVLYRREGIKGAAYESVRLPAHILRIMRSSLDKKEKIKRIGILISGTVEGLSFYPEPDRLP